MNKTIWNKKKYAISQRHRRQLTGQEAYHVKDPESLQELLWVKRKRLGFKTDITAFYSVDMNEQNIAFVLKDEAIFDAFGKFTLVVNNQAFAIYKRHWLRSLMREKWTIRHPTGEEFITVEARSLLISIIRNFRWLPIFGSLEFFIQFIRLQFDIKDKKSGKRIGFFDRKRSIRDNYLLDFNEDTENILDPMIAVGLSIILDSAEKR
jgi:hypothetical protein